jgi:hypothetical protein
MATTIFNVYKDGLDFTAPVTTTTTFSQNSSSGYWIGSSFSATWGGRGLGYTSGYTGPTSGTITSLELRKPDATPIYSISTETIIDPSKASPFFEGLVFNVIDKNVISWIGSSENDKFYFFAQTGSKGNVFDGKAGIDSFELANSRTSYVISSYNSQSKSLSIESPSTGTAITLTNIERLKFADTMVALDIGKDQTAGSGYMLYKAAFNRTPDVGGLGYWISKMDTGMSYSDVAKNFVTSAEFKTAFGGSNPSVNTLVTKLYNNVLNRTPDAGGLAFWQDKLNTGWSTADVLGFFSTSGENVTNVTPLIANGISYTQFVG